MSRSPAPVLLAPHEVAHGDQYRAAARRRRDTTKMKPAAEPKYCPPFIDTESLMSGTYQSRVSIGHNVAQMRYFSAQKRCV
jgi:hypothetical protein